MSKVIVKIFLAVILLMKSYSAFSQNYEIGCYTKINELEGNLNQQLDSGDQFGYSVDAIGDLNNDGVTDLIVGAFTDDDGGNNRGAVYVLFMNSDDTVLRSQKISSTQGGFNGTLDNNDVFGASVSYLGDMNNDGFIEVAVGAEYDGDGGYWHGAVWILSLNTDGTVRAHSKISDFEGGFTGDFNGDVVFGTDVENIGDLNNDGVEDIIVSARRDYDGDPGAGAIWVLFLNTDFSVKNYSKISETEGSFGANLDFEDYFGGSVSVLKDLDNDGIREIAVGAYRDDDGGTDFGSLYIIFLNSSGFVKNYKKISSIVGGGNFDLNSNAIFGKAIGGYSDIDSDGLIEILVGCARCNNSETNAQTGGFYLIELNNDGTVNESFPYSYKIGGFEGELNSGDLFGISVSYISNQDPLKVVVGASKDNEGAIWILNYNEKLDGITIDPITSQCAGNNTGFLLSSLAPNENYLLDFNRDNSGVEIEFSSDENGEFSFDNIEEGNYKNIILEKDGCKFEFSEEIQISKEESLDPEFDAVSTTCESFEDNEIIITNMPASELFTISYDYNGTSSVAEEFTSDSDGKLIIPNVDPGKYSNFEIDFQDCLNTFEIELEVNNLNELEAEFESIPVSNCGAVDGVIEIGNLESGKDYNVSFTVNNEATEVDLTSDSNGTLLLEQLEGGQYSNFYIDDSGCNYYFDESFNLAYNGNVTYQIVQEPICNSDGTGIVEVYGLNPDSGFQMDYLFNDVPQNISIVSNGAGVIKIEDMEEGDFRNITLKLDDCEIFINDFSLSCIPESNTEICYTYPKFFSPNSDGINDRWRVEITDPGCDKSFKCYIYDRYGKLMKVLNGPNEKWDGNFNGKEMPPADYWIRLEFPNLPDFKPEVNHFSLIR